MRIKKSAIYLRLFATEPYPDAGNQHDRCYNYQCNMYAIFAVSETI